MSEMLERMARALCMSRHGGFPVDREARLRDSDNWKGAWWWQAEQDARAALLALREPTKEMVEWASMAEVGSVWEADFGKGHNEEVKWPIGVALLDTGIRNIDAALIDAWKSMVDVALGELAPLSSFSSDTAIDHALQTQGEGEMKFRKKPVVIEAWRNTEDLPHRSLTPAWLSDAMNAGVVWFSGGYHGHFTIKTLEGEMRAEYGDWIIRGVQGELYPCKPDIFEATYERVYSTD